MAEKTAQNMTNGQRWLSFIIVLVISILGAMVMFKASPVFPQLMNDLGFTSSNIGLMMSMYTIIGIVLAFPAGGILGKIGFKWSLAIVCLSLIVGGVLGAVATSVPMMLASRVIEGIANGIIAVVCSAAVPVILPKDKMGTGMGLASIWFPLGAVLSFNIAPVFAAGVGWRGIWWFTVILAVVLFILLLAAFKVPEADQLPDESGSSGTAAVARKPMWASIIVTSLVMACFGCVYGGAQGSFYPTFLIETKGMDSAAASFMASIPNIVTLFAGPIAGILSDKLHTQKGLVVFGAIVMAVLYTFAFSPILGLNWTYLAVQGICCGLLATGMYSLIPRLAQDPGKIGMGMGCLAFFQNLGIFAGSLFFGALSAGGDYYAADLQLLLPVAVVGVVCALVIKLPGKAAEQSVD